jgi:hypothetical protein
MRDFGAILGSSTRFTEPPISNHEYYVEKDSSLKRLFTLGFYTPKYLRTRAPENIPSSVGWFESSSFDPGLEDRRPHTHDDLRQPVVNGRPEERLAAATTLVIARFSPA